MLKVYCCQIFKHLLLKKHSCLVLPKTLEFKAYNVLALTSAKSAFITKTTVSRPNFAKPLFPLASQPLIPINLIEMINFQFSFKRKSKFRFFYSLFIYSCIICLKLSHFELKSLFHHSSNTPIPSRS